MSDREYVIEKIRQAFGANEYPGDLYLQGSYEGCEPEEEVGPFRGRRAWQSIGADVLDTHGAALSFFSEAGFRFFLPAYLIADVQGQLKIADPLFSLIHGFSEVAVEAPVKERRFVLRSGKSALVNPRRYGALTFYDYARYRLSIFTREEAEAIVAYLEHQREVASTDFEKEGISAALDLFWLERSRSAPLAASLARHVQDQEEYVAALMEDRT